MKIINYILLSLLIVTSSFTNQEVEILGNFKMFTTDNLGNIYAVNNKNDITKYDKNGLKKAEINLKVLGDVTSIDATNPLEIYIFYRDQGIIRYFDNNLNNLGETDLYQTFGLNNISVICRSYDNGVWFIDPISLKLKKCDKKGNLLTESINISNLADTSISPQIMLEDGKYVYLKINNNRIMKFDILANYINTITLENFTTFQVKDEKIFYKTADSYFVFNTQTFEKTKFNYLLDKEYFNIRNEGKILYLQDLTSIKVIDIKE